MRPSETISKHCFICYNEVLGHKWIIWNAVLYQHDIRMLLDKRLLIWLLTLSHFEHQYVLGFSYVWEYFYLYRDITEAFIFLRGGPTTWYACAPSLFSLFSTNFSTDWSEFLWSVAITIDIFWSQAAIVGSGICLREGLMSADATCLPHASQKRARRSWRKRVLIACMHFIWMSPNLKVFARHLILSSQSYHLDEVRFLW